MVLIPSSSGQGFKEAYAAQVLGRSIRLNPFFIGAGFKANSNKTGTMRDGLNPFFIQGTDSKVVACRVTR